MRLPRPSVILVVAVISGAAWVWSWRTMYLEIHRWKHVTRSFRFNRPGLPLKVPFVCSVVAPLVFVGTVIAGATRAH